MKKSLLLIFGLMGLVSLMAESGPKRSSILSRLGLDYDPICCDMTKCCPDNGTNCCNMGSCCNNVSNCCTPASSCCSSENTEQESNAVAESNVNQSVSKSKNN